MNQYQTSSVIEARAGRAGARQVRRRLHGCILLPDARAFDNAWCFAVGLGVAPNLFISINWSHAPSVDGTHPMDRNAQLRDGLKQVLYRHAPGVPVVWLEAREKPGSKGEGVHLFFYVPEAIIPIFTAAVMRLVARQSSSVSDTAVDVRPVGPRWRDRRDYVLKGGDDAVTQRYATQRFRKGAQGLIEGPRLRCSHSIGAKAQLDAGWRVGSADDVIHH